jgi:hypothetical protein
MEGKLVGFKAKSYSSGFPASRGCVVDIRPLDEQNQAALQNS